MSPLLLLSLLVACGDKDDGADSGSVAADAPTWEDVGPIYARSCMGCHADGSIAPFALDSYADAKTWAEASAAAVEARTMPPFLVKGDGSCGEWADSEWLTDEEVATVAAWAAAGAPEGEVTPDLSPKAPPTLDGGLIEVQTPDFTPEIVGGTYAEFDEYRCFRTDPGLDEDAFLTGYEVFPGNDAIVHHVIGMPVDPDRARGDGTLSDYMDTLEAEDGRDGWPCFSGAGDGVPILSQPIAWAPGQGAVNYPDGTGVLIPAGYELVFQVHYNLVDPETRGENDQTTIALELADSVEREGFVALNDDFLGSLGGFAEPAIPPGEDAWSYTWDMDSIELLYNYGGDTDGIVGAEIIGMLPHMHEYGESMRVEIDGECAMEVPQWDFNWQRLYFYEEGYALSTGEEHIEVTCTWDTVGETKEITPGWGTYNEMCLPGMFVVLDRI